MFCFSSSSYWINTWRVLYLLYVGHLLSYFFSGWVEWHLSVTSSTTCLYCSRKRLSQALYIHAWNNQWPTKQVQSWAAVTFHICLQKQHPPMDSSLSSAIGTHPSDRQSFVFLWSCRRKLVGRHLHICDLLGRVYGLISITIEQLLLRLDHRLADR